MCKRFFSILLVLTLALAVLTPVFTANAEFFDAPDIELSVPYALLVNLNTGTEVFSRDADAKVYPASTTKIMTAIIVIESCPDLDEIAEISSAASLLFKSAEYTNYARAELDSNERLSVRELLSILMVKSACDAAVVLAEHVSGSEEAFVDAMNAKAEELGCTGTHFVNSTGLHSDEHYTTVRDMSIIAQYALRNPDFVDFFSMSRVHLDKTENHREYTFTTTNYLLLKTHASYYKYATGGKTGTTTKAGRCLVSTAKKNDDEYLCLVFGAKNDSAQKTNPAFDDTAKLFNWAFDNLTVVKIDSLSDGVRFETKLRYAWNHDYATLTVSEDVYAILPRGADTELKHDNADGTETGLIVSAEIPDHLDAPVTQGDPAGSAVYYYRDESGTVTQLATGSVVVYESVDRNFFSYIFTNIGAFFSSTPVLIITIVLLAALIGYIVFRLIRRTRTRRRPAAFRRHKRMKANYRRSFRR